MNGIRQIGGTVSVQSKLCILGRMDQVDLERVLNHFLMWGRVVDRILSFRGKVNVFLTLRLQYCSPSTYSRHIFASLIEKSTLCLRSIANAAGSTSTTGGQFCTTCGPGIPVGYERKTA